MSFSQLVILQLVAFASVAEWNVRCLNLYKKSFGLSLNFGDNFNLW